MVKKKISKKQFLSRAAKANDISIKDITKVYDAIVDEIEKVVSDGYSLSLTGFGVFYLYKHKGHPVQFKGQKAVPDYVVFKFSASDVLNKRLRKAYTDGKVILYKE